MVFKGTSCIFIGWATWGLEPCNKQALRWSKRCRWSSRWRICRWVLEKPQSSKWLYNCRYLSSELYISFFHFSWYIFPRVYSEDFLFVPNLRSMYSVFVSYASGESKEKLACYYVSIFQAGCFEHSMHLYFRLVVLVAKRRNCYFLGFSLFVLILLLCTLSRGLGIWNLLKYS